MCTQFFWIIIIWNTNLTFTWTYENMPKRPLLCSEYKTNYLNQVVREAREAAITLKVCRRQNNIGSRHNIKQQFVSILKSLHITLCFIMCFITSLKIIHHCMIIQNVLPKTWTPSFFNQNNLLYKYEVKFLRGERATGIEVALFYGTTRKRSQ